MSDKVLDSQPINNTVNDYKGIPSNDYSNSYIRYWLNKKFYNWAFSVSDKKTIIDNTNSIDNTNISKIKDNANNYYVSNPDLFKDEAGNVDNSKMVDYQLTLMEQATDKVKYTLEVNVKKVDDEWKVQPLTSTDLDKINGTYQY